MAKTAVRWSGELLWPQNLPDGDIIDISAVVALGVWTHQWLRDRPNRALVGGPAELKHQLQRAAVPILWYDRISDVATDHGGVSLSEREMLWN